MKSSSTTNHTNGYHDNGVSAQAKKQNDDISFTGLDKIHIQDSPNEYDSKGISLATWLRRKRAVTEALINISCSNWHLVAAEDASSKEYSQNHQHQQEEPPQTWQNQHQPGGDLEERLRVAISITKALDEVIRNGTVCSEGYLSSHFSLENIFLDISDDGYCEATFNRVDAGHIVLSLETSTNELEMKNQLGYLGHILIAIFGAANSNYDTGMMIEQETVNEDQPKKKRGKQNWRTILDSSLPLYLTCLISSLLISNTKADDLREEETAVSCQYYESVKQVLQDLQIAAQKPEVYLKRTSHDINQCLRVPRDSFYGRTSELALAMHSLDTVLKFGQPVLCTVSGDAGTGKTTLLDQIKGPLKEAGGFMIRGKFDKATPPNTVIFSAINSFFGEIVKDGYTELQAELKLCITKSVGYGIGVLMSVIPNLQTLVGEYEYNSIEEYNIEETAISHQRWKVLLCRLMNAITDKSRPLAFFMDDLHRCDEVTLDIIQMIVMDPDIRYCLFLGTYRPVKSGVTKMLDSIKSHGVRVVSIKVSCIEKEAVNSLISENLCIPPSLCQSISSTVHSKTGGFILFAANFFQSLYEEGMIRFNLNTRNWEYNINDIKQRKLPADIVQHLSERMARLPKNIQSLLKTAACLGFEFDANLLQMAISVPMLKLVPYATESGFLREIPSSNKFVWAHDQIHLAAYELIPLNKRSSSHLLIATRIYMNTSSDETLSRVIFDVVNNMNVALHLITSQAQRNDVARLNREAGRKAVASSSFRTAAAYYIVGVRLLAGDCWTSNYEFTLILHQEASDVLFITGDFGNLKNVIDEQLSRANCFDDKLQAYYCLVLLLHATSNVKQAMEITRFILRELGATFPEATPDLIYRELLSTKALLANTSQQDLLKTPRLTDKRMLWTMRFMHKFMKYLFSTSVSVLPLVACRMIRMSSENGCSCDSAMGFHAYGWAAHNILQDVEEAYKWGKLSLLFPEILNSPALLPKLTCYFHSFTSFFKEPIQASCDALCKTHQDLLMVGDVQEAFIASFNHCRQMLFAGIDLDAVDKHCASTTLEMTKFAQVHGNLSNSSHHLLILKLIGSNSTKNPFEAFKGVLTEEIRNEDDLLRHALSTGKAGVVQAIRFNRLFLAYWFKRYEEAAEMAALYKTRTMMPLIDIYHAFYEGLTAFHFARQLSEDDPEKWFRLGEKSLACLKTWAMHSTWNWANKYLLLEAECHFSKGQAEEAKKKYYLAVEYARQHRFVHEEGLANELFSTFHASSGNTSGASHHISQARVCYERWGAFAIVERLDALLE